MVVMFSVVVLAMIVAMVVGHIKLAQAILAPVRDFDERPDRRR